MLNVAKTIYVIIITTIFEDDGSTRGLNFSTYTVVPLRIVQLSVVCFSVCVVVC